MSLDALDTSSCIETRLTLSQTNNLLFSHFGDLLQLGNLTHFVLTFVCLHFPLSDSGVLNSLEELCYIYIYIYVCVYIPGNLSNG